MFKHTFHIPVYLLLVIDSFLKNHLLMYGCHVQGSILGLELWNVSFNKLLKTEKPIQIHLVGYTDNVAALITGRNVQQAHFRLALVMCRVNSWMRDTNVIGTKKEFEILRLLQSNKIFAHPRCDDGQQD